MTPSDIAAFMAQLLDAQPGDAILDPGAGLGILSHAARIVCQTPGNAFTLVELEEGCFKHLMASNEWRDSTVLRREFIEFAIDANLHGQTWDRIITNPPYLNFHHFDRAVVDDVSLAFGARMTKFTNLFALFLISATHLLKPGGRLVMISPTELFTTNYGKNALSQLAPGVQLTKVYVFEPEAEPFEHAMTTACITVFDKPEQPSEDVAILTIDNRSGGVQAWHSAGQRRVPLKNILVAPKQVVNPNHGLSASSQAYCTLGELLGVSRGIATGANGFFVLTEDQRKRLDPEGTFCRPVVSRAESLGYGPSFTRESHQALVKAGKPAWLLDMNGHSLEDLPTTLRKYVEEGVRRGYHERYLCKVRNPWFSMEKQNPPAAFVGVFGRDGVRVVKNAAGAVCLAAFHRLYHYPLPAIDDVRVELVLKFLRSSLGKESMDAQSRRYGRGLKKLEPSDLKQVHVPDVRQLPDVDAQEILSQWNSENSDDAWPQALLARVNGVLANSPSAGGSMQLFGQYP